MPDSVSSPLETRISGSFSTRFWLELFSNSAQFPIVNVLLELLIEKPLEYLRAPDLYVMVTASLVQAYWLTRWQTTSHPRRLWGNLIGPTVYTLIEGLLEGPRFFASLNHIAYWAFSLAIGILQALRLRLSKGFSAPLIVIENVVRTSILFVMYAIYETAANPLQTISVNEFFNDPTHQFIGLAVLFLGLNLGLANLLADRYQGLLRETLAQLKTYSEWLLGRDLLRQTFIDPSALSLTRRERTILFMDVRNFTRWSEAQTPEDVVSLLNEYYNVAEAVLTRYETIKFKLSADEVMAVFASTASAGQAALELRQRISALLANYRLGAGIGLHSGPLVEGLLGDVGVKFYDVIGDTVNTAKRIESAACAGEVLISEEVRDTLGQTFQVSGQREISAKGKENPLIVYSLENCISSTSADVSTITSAPM